MRVSMYTLFCFIVSLGVSCPKELFAKVEDHFKGAPNKGEGHQIPNVDFIYMINLDERPEKLASCLIQLQPYGIEPYRFSAVNGWKLTLEDINDVRVVYQPGMKTDLMGTYYPLTGEGPLHEMMSVPGRTYFCHCMSRGAVGIVLSHLSVLQDAIDSGYKTVWVMEDDVEVVQDPEDAFRADCCPRRASRQGKVGYTLHRPGHCQQHNGSVRSMSRVCQTAQFYTRKARTVRQTNGRGKRFSKGRRPLRHVFVYRSPVWYEKNSQLFEGIQGLSSHRHGLSLPIAPEHLHCQRRRCFYATICPQR